MELVKGQGAAVAAVSSSAPSSLSAHDLSWHCRGNGKGVPVSDEKVDGGDGSKGFFNASILENSFNKDGKCNKHFFKRELISYVTRAHRGGWNVAGLCCAVCALCKSISADDYATYTESDVYVHTTASHTSHNISSLCELRICCSLFLLLFSVGHFLSI